MSDRRKIPLNKGDRSPIQIEIEGKSATPYWLGVAIIGAAVVIGFILGIAFSYWQGL